MMVVMNARTILSSDGLVRRSFTVADVDRMVEAGIIEPDERLEIVDGEIFPMSPKGNRHEMLKQHLNIFFAQNLPNGVTFIQEVGWRVGPMLYLEPDYLFFGADRILPDVRGPDALMVVEVADSSLGYELGRKPSLYAGEGVREYWVIDAVTRETHVHLAPTATGYGSTRVYPATVALQPHLIPALKLRMADLPGA